MGRKDVLVVREIDPDYDGAYLSSSYRIGTNGVSFDYYLKTWAQRDSAEKTSKFGLDAITLLALRTVK
jgi:hypothetical protein